MPHDKNKGLLPTPNISQMYQTPLTNKTPLLSQNGYLGNIPLNMSPLVIFPEITGDEPPSFIPINENALRLEERYVSRAFIKNILSKRKAEYLYTLLNKTELTHMDKRKIKGQLIFYMFEPFLQVMIQYISSLSDKDMIIKGSYGLKLLLQENIRINNSKESIKLYNQLHTQDVDIDIYIKEPSKKDYYIENINNLLDLLNNNINSVFVGLINNIYQQFISYYPPTQEDINLQKGPIFEITNIINEMILYSGKAIYEIILSKDQRIYDTSSRDIYKLSIVDKPYDIIYDSFGNSMTQYIIQNGKQIINYNPIMDCNFIIDDGDKYESINKHLVELNNEIIVNKLDLKTGIQLRENIVFSLYVFNFQYYFDEKKRLYCDLNCGDIDTDDKLKGLCHGIVGEYKENKIENKVFLCSKFGKQLKILNDASLSSIIKGGRKTSKVNSNNHKKNKKQNKKTKKRIKKYK
jgi:hypothetical protein